jgi:hypothetical protein
MNSRPISSLRPRLVRKYLWLGPVMLIMSWERTSPKCAYLIGRKDNFRNWLPFAIILSTGRGPAQGFRVALVCIWGLGLGLAWRKR